MAVIDDRTPVGNYTKPNALNKLMDDVERIRGAFDAIGEDIGDAAEDAAAKAPLVHTHEMSAIIGLISALAAKAAIDHLHSLASLTDVDVTGATNGQFFKRVGMMWVPATITLGDITGASFNADAIAETASRIWLTPALKLTYDAKAPLASPAFTGNPTVPTQLVTDNSTRAASTAHVTSKINALINSAPGALDTLNELATALGNDPNFATTMTNALAACVKLATDGILAAGFRSTNVPLGNSGVAAFMSTWAGGNIRSRNNSGAHPWNAPTAVGVFTTLTEVVNVTGAGAITMTGFTKVTGDAFTTTVGDKFLVFEAKTANYTHAHIVALQ